MKRRRKNEDQWDSARILSEALPFIQRYAGKTLVIKFGGHAMGSQELTRDFAKNVVLLRQFGIRPVIVHGGGPQIGKMLLRVSDLETVEIAEMVLSGGINKGLVQAINREGGKAVGLSGKDANLIMAKKLREDLGFAGEPDTVDVSVLNTLAGDGFIPVISPISAGADGAGYNVNADTAAGTIAGALGAARLMLLTDIEGVMDKEKNLLTNLSADDARALISNKTAQGGMIPKLETAIKAVKSGVEAVVILDGRRSNGLLVELFTDIGAGTLIR